MSLTGRQIIVADPATQEYLRGIGENVQDVFHRSGVPTQEDTERAQSTNTGPIQRTADDSLICRMFGVCRNADGRIVLDPSAGGTLQPDSTPGNPYDDAMHRVLGQNPVGRVTALALGVTLIIVGFLLARNPIGLVNVAKSAVGKE